ncbi:MAG: metallophosphoesterase [Polyangia bacterium]
MLSPAARSRRRCRRIAPVAQGAQGARRRGLAALLAIGIVCSGGSGAPAEPVLLDRTATVTPRGRQLRGFAAPPVGWQQPEFDDRAWTEQPLTVPSTSQPSPGSTWVTPAASTSTSATAAGAPGAAAPPDAGIVLAEDGADGGSRGATLPLPAPSPGAPSEPADSPPYALVLGAASALRAAAAQTFPGAPSGAAAGVPSGLWASSVLPEAPVFPACAGTLHLRRRFDLDPSAKVPGQLLLRARYSDGLIAYLNGVEVSRRRMPEAAAPQAQTPVLALDRGTVEPERLYVAVPPGLLRPQGNVLAVEVHGRSLERCPRLDLELVAVAGPRAVRGPYIERLVDGALDLTVETDLPAYAELRYGRGPAPSERDKALRPPKDQPPQTLHRLHVEGLRAGTTYHYRLSVLSEDGARTELPPVSFHTPPPPGRPLRIVVYGDTRSGHAVHAQLVQAILAEDPDLVLHTGDVVERGTEEGDWDRFFAVAGPLISRVPVYLTPGNHEYAPKRRGAERLFALFQTMFPPQPGSSPSPGPSRLGLPSRRAELVPRHEPAQPPPVGAALSDLAAGAAEAPRGFFSLDVAGVHLISLDSNQLSRPEQLAWLEGDLLRLGSRKPRATLVWLHDGPYSSGWHGDSTLAQRELVPLLERHRVSLLISGHDHNYERGRRGQLSYLVSGGGGAELRPLKCGAPGKKRCKHPPQAFFNGHHYVSLEVLPGALRLCPKSLDGSPIEDCQLLRTP